MNKIFILLCVLFHLYFAGVLISSTKPYPPLVPDGEKFENLDELLRNISKQSPVTSVAFSPDGKTIASASLDDTIRLWDANTGENFKTLQGHTLPVTSVAFSPDGKTIASASLDSTIRLWDANTGEHFKTLQGHTRPVTSVAFSPDGKTIASASLDSTIRLWDANTGEHLKTLQGHSDSVYSVAFSPDGKTIASASDDNTIRLWDANTGEHFKTLKGHSSSVTSVAFSPDGKTIASAPLDSTIRLWETNTGEHFKTLQGHTSLVTSVAFSPDGKTIASASYDRTIRLWHANTGEHLKTLQGHTLPVTSVAFSPDGKTIASASWDSTIRLWETNTGENFKTLKGHSSYVTSVAFSPDGKTIASTSWDNTIRLWEAHSGKLIKTEEGSANSKNSVSFSPDGKKRAIAYDNTIQLHQLSGSRWTLSKILIGGSMGNWLCIDKNSNRITRGDDGTLLVTIDESGRITPVPPPKPKQKGTLEIITKPDSLQTLDGEATPFTIKLRNSGKGPIYWIEVLNDLDREQVNTTGEQKNPLVFYPPDTCVRLETDETVEISCKVYADFDYTNPSSQASVLFLKVTSLYNNKEPILLTIPVTTQMPPWFQRIPIIFWFLIQVIIVSGLYYLTLLFHPLTLKLSKFPDELLSLHPRELKRARMLLSHTRRLESVLSSASISKYRFKQSIAFYKEWAPEISCKYLAERLDATLEPISQSDILIYRLKLPNDFILNMDSCFLVYPPEGMEEQEVMSRLKKINGFNTHVFLLILPYERHRSGLYITALEADNMLVAPGLPVLTELLLSNTPLDVFARLVASQVKVTRISPYQTGGGIDKEAVFFGREQLLIHIMQREPANYLLVGGRQLGKSSLLKAIERKYRDNPSIQCHYLVLNSPEIASHLSRTLDLPSDTPLPQLLEQLSSGPRRLFLVDEADKFIATETETGCDTLQHFRSLSEEGKCWFIFAGFWDLYHSVTFDYQSPIKNFGETLTIEALEEDACRQLATKPMGLLNISYESAESVETLIHETGRRANLIAILCNEMLKHLDMTDREIRQEHLEAALDCNAVRSALSGWETYTTDDNTNQLDRVIVYATIGKDGFTLPELMGILETSGCGFEPEQIKQSLARLELGFILKREKQSYTYRVPLFKKMILEQQPETLLAGELKSLS